MDESLQAFEGVDGCVAQSTCQNDNGQCDRLDLHQREERFAEKNLIFLMIIIKRKFLQSEPNRTANPDGHNTEQMSNNQTISRSTIVVVFAIVLTLVVALRATITANL
jgi:hypothetical protein